MRTDFQYLHNVVYLLCLHTRDARYAFQGPSGFLENKTRQYYGGPYCQSGSAGKSAGFLIDRPKFKSRPDHFGEIAFSELFITLCCSDTGGIVFQVLD